MDFCGDVQFPTGNLLREKLPDTAVRTTVLLLFLLVTGNNFNEKRLRNVALARPSPRVSGKMEFCWRDHEDAGCRSNGREASRDTSRMTWTRLSLPGRWWLGKADAPHRWKS